MARSTVAAALAAAVLSLTLASPAAAQRRGVVAPRWRAELGVAMPVTPYVEDANDARVSGGAGPMLGVAAAWDASPATVVELGARLARIPVDVEASGVDLDADAALHADLVAAVGFAVSRRLTLRAGMGLSWLSGDDAVVPFRYGNEAPWHLGGEIGAAFRLPTARPLALALTAHAMRLGAATTDDPTEAGTLTRLLVGVRYGR